jgi:hypothetical protein
LHEDAAEVTRSELSEEIVSLRRLLALVIEEIADHQAILQRLQVQRSVLEAELRGLDSAREFLSRKRR